MHQREDSLSAMYSIETDERKVGGRSPTTVVHRYLSGLETFYADFANIDSRVLYEKCTVALFLFLLEHSISEIDYGSEYSISELHK